MKATLGLGLALAAAKMLRPQGNALEQFFPRPKEYDHHVWAWRRWEAQIEAAAQREVRRILAERRAKPFLDAAEAKRARKAAKRAAVHSR